MSEQSSGREKGEATNCMAPLRRLATVLDEGVVGVESREMVAFLGGELATL
jgi:hypothetical protein